eukprot:TRINITY_DN3833_c0_g1_i4.p1 TRINITY_DN3833_c0_g1~~TRINITY_DN3833_c0_g1_i4.p1  ORF type:complete len:559 (+),score=106.49 TRINITY_DN3833_c0_g1_i4:147-1823(+)
MAAAQMEAAVAASLKGGDLAVVQWLNLVGLAPLATALAEAGFEDLRVVAEMDMADIDSLEISEQMARVHLLDQCGVLKRLFASEPNARQEKLEARLVSHIKIMHERNEVIKGEIQQAKAKKAKKKLSREGNALKKRKEDIENDEAAASASPASNGGSEDSDSEDRKSVVVNKTNELRRSILKKAETGRSPLRSSLIQNPRFRKDNSGVPEEIQEQERMEWSYNNVVYHNEMPPFDLSADALTKVKYNRNHAMWLGHVSCLSYRSPSDVERVAKNIWGYDHCAFIENKSTDTQAFGMADESCVIVGFRGTQEMSDWLTNLKFAQETPWKAHKKYKVHKGFNSAFKSIIDQVEVFVRAHQINSEGQQLPVFLTGHSLGGALANLCFAHFTFWDKEPIPVQGVYTFGQPRVANPALVDALATLSEHTAYYRITNNNDIVPGVPSRGDYKHCGSRMYITPNGAMVNKPAGWDNAAHKIMAEWGDSKFSKGFVLARYFKGLGDHACPAYLRLVLEHFKSDGDVVKLNRTKRTITETEVSKFDQTDFMAQLQQGSAVSNAIKKN